MVFAITLKLLLQPIVRLFERPLLIHIDDFRFCPYHPAGTVATYACVSDWRKPAPGMLLDLLKIWPVDRSNSIFIGDQASDVQAGEAAAVRSYFIGPGETLKGALTKLLGWERGAG
jgi:histidinol phosphatase-like enzyme